MAVPKHLGAYSLECYNSSGGDNPYPDGCTPYRNTFNAVVDEIDLRETYFPGWAAAVSEANAQGVMCSYNEIKQVPPSLLNLRSPSFADAFATFTHAQTITLTPLPTPSRPARSLKP